MYNIRMFSNKTIHVWDISVHYLYVFYFFPNTAIFNNHI